MYHYVRPNDPGLPYFRHLRLDRFCKQLDHFAATDRFVTEEEFRVYLATGEVPSDGVILTFDDGVSDHYDHVYPELARRGIWGIFYVSTGVHHSGKMLDVHRVHVLLGRHGGSRVLAELNEIVTDQMLASERIEEFHARTYRLQDNDAATMQVKRMLNYFVSYDHREQVLDTLCGRLLPEEAELKQSYYATPAQLREMQAGGMTIGSHTVSHPVMSRLSDEEQAREIQDSFSFLEEACGGLPLKTFCYPYGGFHTFTPDTERMLTEQGCLFSFNVEQREIETADLLKRPQALPRYDCNQFAYGAAGCNPVDVSTTTGG